MLNRRKVTWFADGGLPKVTKGAQDVIGRCMGVIQVDQNIRRLETSFLSNVCKYVAKSSSHQIKKWLGILATLSEYEDQEFFLHNEMVEISFREFATAMARRLAEEIREWCPCYEETPLIGDGREMKDQGIMILDQIAEVSNYLEHEAERFRLQIKAREFGNDRFSYPPFSCFSYYKINSDDKSDEENWDVKTEYTESKDCKISVSIWDTREDGALKCVRDCYVKELVKYEKDREYKRNYFVSEDGSVLFNVNSNEDGSVEPFPYNKVTGFDCDLGKERKQRELIKVDPDELDQIDFGRMTENWQGRVNDKIRQNRSFRIIDVPFGKQSEVVEFVEKTVEEAKKTCRVRTNNRGALVAIPGIGLVYGGLILAHNASTKDPDYEIVRDMFGSNVRVVKVEKIDNGS